MRQTVHSAFISSFIILTSFIELTGGEQTNKIEELHYICEGYSNSKHMQYVIGYDNDAEQWLRDQTRSPTTCIYYVVLHSKSPSGGVCWKPLFAHWTASTLFGSIQSLLLEHTEVHD